MEAEVPSGQHLPACFTIRVMFPSEEAARVARAVLSVDPELHGDKAENLRLCRVSVNATFEMLDLVLRTLQEFGPGAGAAAAVPAPAVPTSVTS
eukprot:gene8483-1517_t